MKFDLTEEREVLREAVMRLCARFSATIGAKKIATVALHDFHRAFVGCRLAPSRMLGSTRSIAC